MFKKCSACHQIAAGGKRAAIAKAKLQLGSMFYMATAPLGYYGVGRDKAEEALGFELPRVRGSDIRLSIPGCPTKFGKLDTP